MPTNRLLFVCTGNICRSPMAEGLAGAYASRRGKPVEVASASTLGLRGHPADPNAVAVCEEIDIDLSGHRAQPLTRELVTWATWILVMELAHAHHLRDEHGSSEGRVLMLGTFGGTLEVRDPLGAGRHRFRQTRDELRRCVEAFVDRMPAPA